MLFSIFIKFRSLMISIGLEKYPILQSINRSIMSKIKPNFVNVNGNKIYLDSKDLLSLSINPIHEENETNLVKKEVKKDNIVIDIGASIGYYTLLFAQLVGKNGKVFAFEPEQKNFELLKKNVEVNGYNNIILINKAVSNNTGKKKFLVTDNGQHRIVKNGSTNTNIEVEIISLDDFFKDFDQKIDFIKIDAEGSEYFILEGMKKILKENDHLKIMTELNPTFLREIGIEPIEYAKKLVKNGFKLYDARKIPGKIIPTNIDKLKERIKELAVKESTDLFCIK